MSLHWDIGEIDRRREMGMSNNPTGIGGFTAEYNKENKSNFEYDSVEIGRASCRERV